MPRRPLSPPTIPNLIDELRDRALDFLDNLLAGVGETLKDKARPLPQFPPIPGEINPPPKRPKTRQTGGRTRNPGKSRQTPMERGKRRGNTLYDDLGVLPDADFEVIKAAYRALAFKLHPDRSPGSGNISRMLKINAAWEVLQDSKKRAVYDRSLNQ